MNLAVYGNGLADVMVHADYVIKRDVYPQRMHLCSKNIRGISFFVQRISVYIKKYIMVVVA